MLTLRGADGRAHSYRAVLLDIDRTCGEDGKTERDVLAAMLDGYGGPTLRAETEHVLERARAGAPGVLGGLARELVELQRHYPRARFDVAAAVSQYRNRSLQLLPERWKTYPGVREFVRACDERNVPHAVVTNGWSEMQRAKAGLIGYKGQLYVSDEMGLWKPQAGAFLLPLATWGVAPSEVLYIGDNPGGDMDGAHGAGEDGAWVNASRQPFGGASRKPEFDVASVGELLGLIVT
jgi:putative hydrolase of the HAD superfamily